MNWEWYKVMIRMNKFYLIWMVILLQAVALMAFPVLKERPEKGVVLHFNNQGHPTRFGSGWEYFAVQFGALAITAATFLALYKLPSLCPIKPYSIRLMQKILMVGFLISEGVVFVQLYDSAFLAYHGKN